MKDDGDWFEVDDAEPGRDRVLLGAERLPRQPAEDRSARDDVHPTPGEPAAGDAYLLCSDGLWSAVTSSGMEMSCEVDRRPNHSPRSSARRNSTLKRNSAYSNINRKKICPSKRGPLR